MTDSWGQVDDGEKTHDESMSRRSGRRRTSGHVASMQTTNIVQRATMFVIYILVAQ